MPANNYNLKANSPSLFCAIRARSLYDHVSPSIFFGPQVRVNSRLFLIAKAQRGSTKKRLERCSRIALNHSRTRRKQMTECEQVYAAEQKAQHDYHPGPMRFKIEQDAVEGFARSTVTLAGFECEIFPFLNFLDSEPEGWCQKDVTSDGTTYSGAIYFDQRSLCKWTICHEFAHWLDPGHPEKVAHHNAEFREIMVKLVKHGIAEYASWGLANEYKNHGFRYIFIP